MLFDIFFPFTWQDVADVLVVSVIIHRLFLLLRGTTALQVMFGLLFLWLAEAIAEAAGLLLTSWLLRGIGAVAVLAVVVVFRNELRELFLKSNPIRFFLGRSSRMLEEDLGAVVESAFQLARSRTGAVIVLQNRDQLGAHLREGFDLDGRVDPRIIECIFNKESPVHDGAIITAKNRITRVGTFLPLTQKEGLSQHYGTRHRAALGLSEVSDAIVLVVSEERGDVSLVHSSEIEQFTNPAQLRNRLEGLMQRGKSKTDLSITRSRLAYAGGLLLTFLLVAGVWGMYTGRQLSLITVAASLDFRNLPEQLELKTVSPEKIEAQISGRQRIVNTLRAEEVRAFVDLTEMRSGTHEIVLNRQNIEVPLGLEIVRLTPSTIRLELEERIEKAVAVRPRIVGVPPLGFQIEKMSVTPESVTLRGPESILAKVGSLYTEQVDLSQLEPARGTQTVEAPLVLSSPSLRLIAGQPSVFQVRIDFGSQRTPVEQLPEGTGNFHEVRIGDTLWDISRRYGLTVSELRERNNLTPEDAIHPGQMLRLDATSQE
ncbi:MAG TPA: diadenylate cyclase [Acidobacteriota bacterium]|nr:diadenylate cyclase [Acidobacteriota bacterium]